MGAISFRVGEGSRLSYMEKNQYLKIAQRKIRIFPFVPHVNGCILMGGILVGTTANYMFLHNDLLCNCMYSVAGGTKRKAGRGG